MKLSNIEQGQKVFIDANIFIYHFHGSSKDCRGFLSRCADKEIPAMTSYETLMEVTHKLMISEAVAKKLAPPTGATGALKRRGSIIKKLNNYKLCISQILGLTEEVHFNNREAFQLSLALQSEHGLMVRDSLTLAVMQLSGVTSIATNDSDFRRISGIRCYSPSDIN